MGLLDILTEFLSSGSGPVQGAAPGTGNGDGTDDEQAVDEEEPAPDPEPYDVPLEDLNQEEQIETLEHRLDGLEDELHDSTGQLETIQGSQQQVAERIEDMNDTVRQLLGIYDQLTANANPFVEANQPGVAEDDVEGFGFGPEQTQQQQAAAPVPSLGGGQQESGGAVSFDDLKGGPAAADNEIEVETVAGSSDAHDDDAESADTDDAEADSFVSAADDADAKLASLADTYATDIIVFEWLTDLVRTGGPSATLRAISYYEEMGWISPAVKHHLENVLSAPDLDMIVDPAREPEELTGDDHAESYEYILKLEAVQNAMNDTN
ncbi:FlaD/FlaE family flagellar protein [Haloarchaeobius sp. DFWS5]|uniref:FlaD/FlaE family flagellar protein n=1 Tax=Haloarchaeobius sp. DFWS5 TaxID=3446114 RepID=UPI003EBD297D